MRTVDDWLDLAAAAEGSEQDEHLAGAEGAVHLCWEWRRLLSGARDRMLGSPAWRARVADRLLVLSLEKVDVWGAVDVARTRLEQGDEAGARAALDAMLSRFGPEVSAWHYACLAREWARDLGDLAAARRCLDLCESARLKDVCELAEARASTLGEVEEAKLMLGAIQPADAREAWTLSNAWLSLEVPDRADEVLNRAEQDAASLSDALTVVHAWASHRRPERAAAALERAIARAISPEDWLLAAEAANDLRLPDRVRSTLERAETAGPLEGATRVKLAAAWLWLNDAARADAISARGPRPEDIAPLVREIPGVPPDPAGLLDWLAAQISEQSLHQIAGADYGMGFDKHLAALQDIVRSRRVPRPLPWEPGEVLRLRRWEQGDRIDHLQRAFCCVVLGLGGDDADDVAPILVESALALGEPARSLTAGFLAWWAAITEEELCTDLFAALWAMALLLSAVDPDDPRLDALAALAEGLSSEGMNASTVLRYCVRRELWEQLTKIHVDANRPRGARWSHLLALPPPAAG